MMFFALFSAVAALAAAPVGLKLATDYSLAPPPVAVKKVEVREESKDPCARSVCADLKRVSPNPLAEKGRNGNYLDRFGRSPLDDSNQAFLNRVSGQNVGPGGNSFESYSGSINRAINRDFGAR